MSFEILDSPSYKTPILLSTQSVSVPSIPDYSFQVTEYVKSSREINKIIAKVKQLFL